LNPTLNESIALATLLYDGVSDCTDTPHIEHLLWVMRALPNDVIDADRHLAILHDVIDGCQPRLALLMQTRGIAEPRNVVAYIEYFRVAGYSDYVVDGLILLTRSMWAMGYLNYIRNIIASGHRGAMLVKYWANRHDSDPARLARVRPDYQRQATGLASRARRSTAMLVTALGLSEPI
jgi:hypothetical protein